MNVLICPKAIRKKHIFFILLIFFIIKSIDCLKVNNLKSNKARIVGGRPVDISRIPYQALVSVKRDSKVIAICGGVIISLSYILTTAHCTYKLAGTTFDVVTGFKSPTELKETEVQKIIRHGNFNPRTHVNDLALLQLKEPLEFSEIQRPIRLATPRNKILRRGDQMLISGYGRTQRSTVNRDGVLRSAYVTLTSKVYCRVMYLYYTIVSGLRITNQMFCASAYLRAPCIGDGGGPGVVRNMLYGITSFGGGCGNRYIPAVYTYIPKYYSWILRNVGEEAEFVRELAGDKGRGGTTTTSENPPAENPPE